MANSAVDKSAGTRARILDAAEALFIQHGYDGTSLRLVTKAAAVNLGAVNYHFGGKEGLFEALLAARLDPMHSARMTLLDEYEAAAAARPLDCERILGALFIPALDIARDPARGGPDFLRFLGRAYVDPSSLLRKFLSERYAPTISRFKDAFGRALPHLGRQELSWRLHFTLGALAYTLAGADAWKLISALKSGNSATDVGDDELLLHRLAPFLIAGLQAPAPMGLQDGSIRNGRSPDAPYEREASITLSRESKLS